MLSASTAGSPCQVSLVSIFAVKLEISHLFQSRRCNKRRVVGHAIIFRLLLDPLVHDLSSLLNSSSSRPEYVQQFVVCVLPSGRNRQRSLSWVRVVQCLSEVTCRRIPKLNDIVELLRFLISDLCSPGTFPWSPQRSSGTLTVSNGVWGFLSWICCSNSSQCLDWHHTRHVLVIDRSFSNHTLVVLGPNNVCRHSVLPILFKRYGRSSGFGIPDSSGTVSRSHVCDRVHVSHPSSLNGLLHLLTTGTCCIHHLIRKCTCENSTVFLPRSTLDSWAVNGADQTICSMVVVPSQRSGLVLAFHVPHDGTRVLASLKPTVGTVITTSPDFESTTWIIWGTAASQDSRRSRVTMLLAPELRLSSISADSLTSGRWCASSCRFRLLLAMLFSRLLLAMLFSRLLLAMLLCCGLRPPSISCQPPIRACIWSRTLNLEISSAAYSRKSRLKVFAFCIISLSMDTNRHSRPSPSCHVSRAVSDPLITSDAKPPESDMWTPWKTNFSLLHCQDSLGTHTIWYRTLSSMSRLAFNSSLGKFHDTDETVLSYTWWAPSDCRKSVLFPTRSPERRVTCSAVPRIILKEIGPDDGACVLILLMRSSSARSGDSSVPATVPFDLRDTLATFRQTPHQDSSLH